MKILKHILVALAALFLTLGVPTLSYVDVPALFSGNADAVTHASTYLPDAPSGEFYVLVNKRTQQGYTDQWREFFSDGDAGVIMSDNSCKVIIGDVSAQQLAERFQARLPENQMTLSAENGLLLVSKAENGIFDALIVSSEMAESYKMQDILTRGWIECVIIKGE